MRLGIMQPYFFPYLEYFRLIAACDLWIGFDTVKYNRKSWMSRNRIVNKDKGWTYIGVPISSKSSQQTVQFAAIDYSQDWQRDIFNKLKIYEKDAPFYGETVDLLRGIFETDHKTLASLNMTALRTICDYLGIKTEIASLSDLSLDLPSKCPPGEWALLISQELGADQYLNASGGKELFDRDRYRNAGVDLQFHRHIEFEYHTGPFEFVPDLSIVDTMMWVDTDTMNGLVKSCHGDERARDFTVSP